MEFRLEETERDKTDVPVPCSLVSPGSPFQYRQTAPPKPPNPIKHVKPVTLKCHLYNNLLSYQLIAMCIVSYRKWGKPSGVTETSIPLAHTGARTHLFRGHSNARSHTHSLNTHTHSFSLADTLKGLHFVQKGEGGGKGMKDSILGGLYRLQLCCSVAK